MRKALRLPHLCAWLPLLRFRSWSELQTKSGALKAERLAQAILQVAFVREMDGTRIVDKKDKGRRIDPGLSRVIDFEGLRANNRGIVAANRFLQHLIEPRGLNAQVAHACDAQRGLKN